MKPSRRLPNRCVALTGAVALVAGAASAILAGSDSPLKIVGVTVQGSAVQVQILNLGSETRAAMVQVRAVVEGCEMVASAPVLVYGGQKAFVEVAMASPIGEVIEVEGVLDDGSPFVN